MIINKTTILYAAILAFALVLIGGAYYQGSKSGYQDGYIEASDSKNCGKSESPWGK